MKKGYVTSLGVVFALALILPVVSCFEVVDCEKDLMDADYFEKIILY